jgi:hypothetical protein
VRRVATASVIALALVLGVMAYALMHDVLDGLSFTRSTTSWGLWAAGLFVGGLVLIVMETASEWLLGHDEPRDRGPRRFRRAALAVVIVAMMVATIAALSGAL